MLCKSQSFVIHNWTNNNNDDDDDDDDDDNNNETTPTKSLATSTFMNSRK